MAETLTPNQASDSEDEDLLTDKTLRSLGLEVDHAYSDPIVVLIAGTV